MTDPEEVLEHIREQRDKELTELLVRLTTTGQLEWTRKTDYNGNPEFHTVYNAHDPKKKIEVVCRQGTFWVTGCGSVKNPTLFQTVMEIEKQRLDEQRRIAADLRDKEIERCLSILRDVALDDVEKEALELYDRTHSDDKEVWTDTLNTSSDGPFSLKPAPSPPVRKRLFRT